MNKQHISLTLFFVGCVSGALYFSPFLQSPFLKLSHSIKLIYLNQVHSFNQTVTEHFNQKNTILRLQRENRYYERELLTMHQIADEYSNMLREQNSSIKTLPSIGLVRSISYVRMGDPHKLWIEMDHFDPKQVYGLLYRGYAAGIVVANNKRPMALLNGDLKSTYAVSVGSSQAPGIVRGNNERKLIVDFIPTWVPIAIGDEVITSGLDQIFLSGLQVGKVISISRASGYQSAVVEPYFYAKKPAYFHIITKVR
ncbi:MAG: rod shape-determining protein MreC [Sulfuricurvum sp.]|nr:rod shape-determining protein MreC [Sulfuricurvum sp.]MDP3023462.1 rod shape-determining protein MreC [Sulfuricurvum sp.]MDP3118811.1 rod shape-determining protein MreC [Sulfuricurvum sp.]